MQEIDIKCKRSISSSESMHVFASVSDLLGLFLVLFVSANNSSLHHHTACLQGHSGSPAFWMPFFVFLKKARPASLCHTRLPPASCKVIRQSSVLQSLSFFRQSIDRLLGSTTVCFCDLSYSFTFFVLLHAFVEGYILHGSVIFVLFLRRALRLQEQI